MLLHVFKVLYFNMFLQYWHIPIRYLKKGAGSAFTPNHSEEKAVNVYEDSDVFCVTRDPLARALSEFNVRVRGRESERER